jgi:tetratricopeptide (TPR) repeat protein
MTESEPARQNAQGSHIAQADRGGTAIVAGGDVTIHQAPPLRLPLQRPRRAEHFTDREAELERLLADLQPGRVATLCGPGGIGKTALAAEALWTLAPGEGPPRRFPGGILWHDFYAQPQADLALQAIALACGEEPRPSPAAGAQRALAGRRALLVLDGAEQADDLRAVLALQGACGVLITSRSRGDAPGGQLENVCALPLPEAVRLLRAWGGARAADEKATRRICELLGGLPLALRLAGSYLAQREEEAADYLEWLQETPLAALERGTRQRDSVPLLLERSVEQVSAGARRALGAVGRLAQAEFGREAVAAALGVSAREAGRWLGESVNYGLLLREGRRYRVSHALVHTFARKRLAGDALGRLADYYDALVREQRERGLPGYGALDAERAHVMAVLAGCVAEQDWERARSLAWAVEDYLDIQGHWTERVSAIEAGLAAARALEHRRDEGAFLGNLGNAYAALGQVERAIEHYQAALSI